MPNEHKTDTPDKVTRQERARAHLEEAWLRCAELGNPKNPNSEPSDVGALCTALYATSYQAHHDLESLKYALDGVIFQMRMLTECIYQPRNSQPHPHLPESR